MKPSQLKTAITELVRLKRPGFIWGPPGIGKSDIIRAVAKEQKLDLIDKRLAQSDPTELKGYPWPDQAKKVMTFFRDSTLPTKGKGILFLDELPHAPQAVQSVAFQLILDRKVGDYTLPDGWAVIAAGNRTTDRSGAHTVNAALANRFVHLDLEVDLDEWIEWGVNNGVSDLTRGYIRYRPANLCVEKIEAGAKAFPTPRSWHFADQIVQGNLPHELKMELIKGTVGEGIAAEFMGYVRDHAQLVNIDRILVDPERAPLPEGPAATYAVLAALEGHTTAGNLDRLMKYVNRVDKEFQTVFIESITRSKPETCDTKAYITWVRENRAMLT